MECSETDRSSRRARSTRSAIPPCACPSLPEASSTPHQGREDSGAALPGRSLEVETTGSPKFPGDPNACMPCSQTPARPRRQASPNPFAGRPSSMISSALRYGLPSFPRRRLSPSAVFRGSITRPTSSLSTLRRLGERPRPRKTRFRWVANPCLTGSTLMMRGLAPQGLNEGFRSAPTSLPPSLGFAWRKENNRGAHFPGSIATRRKTLSLPHEPSTEVSAVRRSPHELDRIRTRGCGCSRTAWSNRQAVGSS